MMRSQKLVLLTLLAACTARDPRPVTASSDKHTWAVTELPPIHPAAGSPGELIDPNSLAVDDQGRVYVGDQKPVNVKIFDSTGALVRLIGREGDGPGELRSAYVAVRGRWLLVHDPEADRTSFFDTSGTFLRVFHSVGNYSDEVAFDARWRAVLPMSYTRRSRVDKADDERTGFHLRFDTLGTLLDTISVPNLAKPRYWTVRGSGRIAVAAVPIPFLPQTIWGYGGDSGLLYGASDAYTIIRADGGRDSSFVMRRAWTPEALDDSVRNASIEPVIQSLKNEGMDEVALRKAFNLNEVPTTAPSFLRLVQDDGGHIWVQRPGHDGMTPFDILDSSGVYLGIVSVPAGLAPHIPLRIRHGLLYAAVVDEAGFPVVRRWAIQDGRDGQDGPDGRVPGAERLGVGRL
jgi:hypothetical protein